jgi:hypothetical protein
MKNPICRPSMRKIDRGYHIEVTDKTTDICFVINVYGDLNNDKFGPVTRVELTSFDKGVVETREPQKDFNYKHSS